MSRGSKFSALRKGPLVGPSQGDRGVGAVARSGTGGHEPQVTELRPQR